MMRSRRVVRSALWPAFAVFSVVVLSAALVVAQEYPEPEGMPLPPGSLVYPLAPDHEATRGLPATENGLPNIVITGYWPPTNDMLRPFSPNLDQNPAGWVGSDWEGRGYNIYAFFPEFPNGLGRGEGDFEVDYQDTSADFWAVTGVLSPVAVVTTGRTSNNHHWRLEGGARNYTPMSWAADYLVPTRPTPELPIASEPAPYDRMSTLPIDDIIAAVNLSGSAATPFATALDTSNFLCDFNGYHANWYRALHFAAGDPTPCRVAGHIHVGYAMTLADAELAAEATLRAVIAYLDALVLVDGFESGDLAAWTASVP